MRIANSYNTFSLELFRNIVGSALAAAGVGGCGFHFTDRGGHAGAVMFLAGVRRSQMEAGPGAGPVSGQHREFSQRELRIDAPAA